MTFTELAAAIDAAETRTAERRITVLDTERAVEAFLAQKGMELAILQEDVAAAKEAWEWSKTETHDLYGELQSKMPVMKVAPTAPNVGTIPSTSDMKQIVLEGNRIRDARSK